MTEEIEGTRKDTDRDDRCNVECIWYEGESCGGIG